MQKFVHFIAVLVRCKRRWMHFYAIAVYMSFIWAGIKTICLFFIDSRFICSNIVFVGHFLLLGKIKCNQYALEITRWP